VIASLLPARLNRQAYRHNEAIHLPSRIRPPSHSNLLTLLECDRISFLFFARSGDAGLGGDVISSCGKWRLGRFCQSQLGVCFLYVTAAAPRRPGLTGAARTIHVDDEFNGTKYVQRHVEKVQEGVQRGSGRMRTYISGVEVV
jgi:hypothetical protein